MAKEKNHFKIVKSDRTYPNCKQVFEKRVRIKPSRRYRSYAWWYYCKCGQMYMPEEAKSWKSVNAEQGPDQRLGTELNIHCANHAVKTSIATKKTSTTQWKPKPSVFNPLPGTTFYSGESPPW